MRQKIRFRPGLPGLPSPASVSGRLGNGRLGNGRLGNGTVHFVQLAGLGAKAASSPMEFTDIKAPAPVEGTPPWQDPRWVAAAEDWIDAGCARAGLARTGPALARCRPYSVVARVPTGDGSLWFKASPPASGFEPALLAALA